MSTESTTSTPTPPETSRLAPRPSGRSTWRLSRRGVQTVALLELRQRVRSTRWIAVLLVWTTAIGVITFLVWRAMDKMVGDASDLRRSAGQAMFGVIVFLVLSLGALVSPALSATSVNGDRSAGVLATLQTTLLSPAEIAFGKLLAAWTASLALLVTSSPFILWAYLEGGTPASRLLVILALLAVILLVVCAVGLGWSAVASRTAISAVLTYLTVALLGVGLPLLFGLITMVVSTTHEEQVSVPVRWSEDGSQILECQVQTVGVTDSHTRQTWWVLAASPYVVIADAAPRPRLGNHDSADLLTSISEGVRSLRLGETGPTPCTVGADPSFSEYAQNRERALRRGRLGVTWPYGLVTNLLLGGAFTVATVLRLRAPARKLPRGARVA